MGKKRIRNKSDLIFNLLRTNFKDQSEEQISDILKYLCEETPLWYYDDQLLRTRTLRVFTELVRNKLVPASSMELVRDFLCELQVLEARDDFHTFVRLTAEVVIPNKYKDGRHIEIICEHLQKLYFSYEKYEEDPKKYRTDRLQVFLPPRSMKSVLCSILFPAWILGRNPKYRVLLVGNSVQTATDVFGRPLKNLLESEEYRAIFPETRLDPKASSNQRFFTTLNGGYYCAGAGTAIAGRGGDFIICDDMLSEQSAFSKAERTKINNNYIPGIRSRSQPGAAELIINTRWVLDDPSGFLMKVDGVKGEDTKKKNQYYRPWKVISIPAILDDAAVETLSRPSDPEGLFEKGNSYWPEYKTLEELNALRENYLNTEPWKWYALYMQNPVPEAGNIVKRSDWQVWPKDEKLPQISQVIVSMDTAFSEKERADFSAITVWGVFHKANEGINGITEVPNLMLIHAEKGKWSFPDLCLKAREIKEDERWKGRVDFFIIEKKQSGIGLLQELHRQGYPLVEYDPRTKKEERLQAAAMLMQAGRVWVPQGRDWAEEVVEEVCNFPSAPHDDYTDTVSMTVIWMRDNGIIRHKGYDWDEDEDDDGWDSNKRQGTSYWASLLGGT